ncbi:tRNA (adenosine(37)-N6)-threonylcarbamoyltransferase complex dimerization subunit type 1 TsaB [Chitinophaga horti]|uniref:tRNA (Adenosine(37)-N6)-threonylcarbamoyltransferase complex dimerization subunit type 1 TsaB n=1 Tax=Chitinophaga horti TaxID=2920382 RepID=A0ABY6J072_9BACT|nr:tRNA (adenosine(37)-N6)-threonylcarbamoyltransferase complex dimerization subunit type 1 TsaB [Chitinophaga horti]UYQ93020.1 tRNA (adenosine(37)-N6)-threonylcarbamoyltransferase complex dimerization subunit type 1 TsaB [Chitinophaga horti]
MNDTAFVNCYGQNTFSKWKRSWPTVKIVALILNIDTATSIGSVCLANDGEVLQLIRNAEQKDHAAKLPSFIQQVLDAARITARDLDAVCVSAGPGSYTGLRVGAATAKGLCYAWRKPLIAISTLKMMASGMINTAKERETLYCPMIDARRMEVFTAVYDAGLQPLLAPQALILDDSSYSEWLKTKQVLFFGDGAAKWQPALAHEPNALFPPYEISAAHMAPLADKAFGQNDFEDLAYFAPHYLKAFFHPGSK